MSEALERLRESVERLKASAAARDANAPTGFPDSAQPTRVNDAPAILPAKRKPPRATKPFRKGKGKDRDPRIASQRGNVGLTLVEWWSRLAAIDPDGNARYPADALTRIVDDPKSDHVKAAAAAGLLRARRLDFSRNGLPLAANDLDRLLDRTIGKPTTRVEVARVDKPTLADMRAELLALVERRPDLARIVMTERPRLISQADSFESGDGPETAVESAG